MYALALMVLVQAPPPVVPPGGLRKLGPGQEGPREQTVQVASYPEPTPPTTTWRTRIPLIERPPFRFGLFWIPLEIREMVDRENPRPGDEG
jgi:hypothetical protein